MNLKLWIDNVREPPDETWDSVTTSEAAIELMTYFQTEGMLWCDRDTISFPYHLEGDDTVLPVIIWMVSQHFRFHTYVIRNCSWEERAWLTHTIESRLA